MRREYIRFGLLNIFTSLGATLVVIASVTIELGPPDVSKDLLEAFRLNNENEYFQVFSEIVEYNEALAIVKIFVFLV